MTTINGRPVHRIRLGKQGPSGPAGPTSLNEIEFTGSNLVLDATHAGKFIVMNAPTPQTVTLPAGVWPIVDGKVMQAVFHRYGAGTVQFVAGSGAPAIRSEGGMRKIAAVDGQVSVSATNAGGTPHYILAGRLGV